MSETTNDLKKYRMKIIVRFLVCIGILYLAAGVYTISQKNNKTSTITETKSAESEQKTANESTQSPIHKSWIHTTQHDAISNNNIQISTTQSKYPLNFSFPYQGEQYAKLLVRRHPRYGLDVILQIEKGQFLAGVTGVTVNARFDEKTTTSFHAVGPEDYDSKTLFLNNEAKFLSLLAKSKVLILSTSVYQEGEQTMIFDVENFDAKRFQNK